MLTIQTAEILGYYLAYDTSYLFQILFKTLGMILSYVKISTTMELVQ